MPSTITLTTDFGMEDHFVAAMKGVILTLLPAARIVDVSHEVGRFQINEAAYVIAEAYRWFPKKTVHVVVVDPGVGSARRPIVVEADGHYFVGPDNGVFGLVFARHMVKVRHITNKKYTLPAMSQTFHGRDVFAPVGAYLARGLRPSHLGAIVDDYTRSAAERPLRTGEQSWQGVVLKVDHFGNVITNFRAEEFPQIAGGRFVLAGGMRPVERLVNCYAECADGEAAAIVGSSGYVELVMNQGSAARILGYAAGSIVELRTW